MKRRPLKEIRREEIVQSALEVMARRGWSDFSIEEVAKQAGMSRSVIWYHFRDRAELFAAILDHCREYVAGKRTEARTEAPDEASELRAIVHDAFQMIRHDPIVFQVFLHFAADGRTEPEIGAMTRDMYREFFQYGSDRIRRGQERGLFRQDLDPEATGVQVITVISGLALHWVLDPGCYPFEELTRQAEEMLFGYLCPAGRGYAPPGATSAAGVGASPDSRAVPTG